ncbi:MAG TPA: hypothetical protein VG755_01395, partial [Nannocystaceae bacterium]|nr:hypothetical protein [Nannocystaceae bacterium]
ASLKLETIEGSLATETCESNSIDSTIQLLNAAGTALITDDDSGRGFCSLVDGTGDIANNAPPAHALPGGLYYVRVQTAGSAASAQFTYRLVATIRTP